MQADPPSKEVLEAGLAQAEAALVDATAPNAVALYARGLASLELGRLLTRGEPFKQRSHMAASELFRNSQESFSNARKALPEQANLAGLRSELDRLIAEGAGYEVFLSRSLELEQRGDLKGAASALLRGVTRHRSRELAMSWVEAQWRSGTLAEADLNKLLNELIQADTVKPDDAEYRTLRGVIGVIGVWRTLTDADDSKPVDQQQAQLLARLLAGLADLRAVPSDVAEEIRWSNAAFIVLGESTALLLDKSRETMEANQALQRVPLIVAELERLVAGRAPHEQVRLLEAVQLARLAEGYLALRLAPDYQDRARLAFAAAEDAGAKLPKGSMGIRPVGGAMLRAILQRDGSNSDRLAQEERQLRVSLQKMLPALIVVQMSEPKTVANSLLAAQRNARVAAPAWDPRKQLDARDTTSAREGLLADSRATTAIALVAAKRSDVALQELFTDLWPSVDVTDLKAVDWNLIRNKSAELTDPLTVYALGLATEEYAIFNLRTDADAPLKATLLSDSLASFERVSAMLRDISAWRERWPYLVSLSLAACDRLGNEESAVSQAKTLRAALRLTEARGVLEQAQQRHPRSITLRQELVQALMDEAQLSPGKEQDLLGEALTQLEDVKSKEPHLPTSTLFTLAELRERLGKEVEASQAYREVIDRSDNKVEKLKARSRLVVLQVRNPN